MALMEGVPTRTEPTLPAARTFVVQFGGEPTLAADGAPRGRVEHLVSGLTARFDTWSELQGFVEQVLHSPDATRTEG
jgi:hypothetical protein